MLCTMLLRSVLVAVLLGCGALFTGCGPKDVPAKQEFSDTDKQQLEELNKQRVDEWGKQVK